VQDKSKKKFSTSLNASSGVLSIFVFAVFIAGTNFQPYHSSHYDNNSNSGYYSNHHTYHDHHRVHHEIVVIKPTFTSAAYRPGGFYDYFRGHCDTRCLTVPVYHTREPNGSMKYAASNNALRMIKEQGIADVVTDQRVTKEPHLLSNYRKVIVLHNEYVTQSEFDAITHHPNVLYLYPNALYALVSYHPKDATITLERGHDYRGASNAFGWGPSKSTKYEYDTSCHGWRLIRVINGEMLNCYPEYHILHNEKLWEAARA
jgi:hypothetical protein